MNSLTGEKDSDFTMVEERGSSSKRQAAGSTNTPNFSPTNQATPPGRTSLPIAELATMDELHGSGGNEALTERVGGGYQRKGGSNKRPTNLFIDTDEDVLG